MVGGRGPIRGWAPIDFGLWSVRPTELARTGHPAETSEDYVGWFAGPRSGGTRAGQPKAFAVPSRSRTEKAQAKAPASSRHLSGRTRETRIGQLSCDAPEEVAAPSAPLLGA